jgi:hypothetical protein
MRLEVLSGGLRAVWDRGDVEPGRIRASFLLGIEMLLERVRFLRRLRP